MVTCFVNPCLKPNKIFNPSLTLINYSHHWTLQLYFLLSLTGNQQQFVANKVSSRILRMEERKAKKPHILAEQFAVLPVMIYYTKQKVNTFRKFSDYQNQISSG